MDVDTSISKCLNLAPFLSSPVQEISLTKTFTWNISLLETQQNTGYQEALFYWLSRSLRKGSLVWLFRLAKFARIPSWGEEHNSIGLSGSLREEAFKPTSLFSISLVQDSGNNQVDKIRIWHGLATFALLHRHGLRSTLITSQFPVDHWHELIEDPTLADAILDRIIHNAYKINLKGDSMRKTKSKLTQHPHKD